MAWYDELTNLMPVDKKTVQERDRDDMIEQMRYYAIRYGGWSAVVAILAKITIDEPEVGR